MQDLLLDVLPQEYSDHLIRRAGGQACLEISRYSRQFPNRGFTTKLSDYK
jgi:hypothetical protein